MARRRIVLLAGLMTLGVTAVASRAAHATDTFIYVHGWDIDSVDYSNCQGQTTCPGYWQEQLNVNIRHVGWNTAVDWRSSTTASRAFNLLHQYCRTDQGNRCRIVCHSTGCAITGKVLSWYAAHNTPWTIERVISLGSAEGGTEMAFGSEWFGNPTGQYLSPEIVRGHYNHNQTSGVPFFHIAGYDGRFGPSWFNYGNDDGVVPFHSACGYSSQGRYDRCSGQGAKWTLHSAAAYCGNDGCNKTHSQLKTNEFQFEVMVSNP